MDSQTDTPTLPDHRPIYFEDLTPGVRFSLGSRRVERDEIIAFARQFDPQPFHVDENAPETRAAGGLMASGWHSCSILMRLICDHFLIKAENGVSPGVKDLRWPAPVRPGDTLTGFGKVLEARPSTTRPDQGIVRIRYSAVNQHGRLVVRMDSTAFFRRREDQRK
jgi:acyl dehydratase